jgi:hypothetical protein
MSFSVSLRASLAHSDFIACVVERARKGVVWLGVKGFISSHMELLAGKLILV